MAYSPLGYFPQPILFATKILQSHSVQFHLDTIVVSWSCLRKYWVKKLYFGKAKTGIVCASTKEIPYWWRKVCPERSQELWLVDAVIILFSFSLRMTDIRQKFTTVKCKLNWIYYKTVIIHEITIISWECWISLADEINRRGEIETNLV